jgi:hypothetical protein
MNKHISSAYLATLVLGLGISTCLADGGTNRIVVVAQQGESSDLAPDVAKHVGSSFRTPAEDSAVVIPVAGSPADVAVAMSSVRAPAHRAVLVLIDRFESKWASVPVFASNGVAIVNLTAYRNGITASPESQRIYRQRIERESVRAVGLALGMKNCLFPLCAMSDSKTMAELDAKPRNLCPHCQILSEPLLDKANLPLVTPVFRPGEKR